jgi:colanic acid/amylovoran biosynthesis protein
MSARKRVLLTGGNFVNKGAEAMVRTVERQMLPALNDAEGLLATRSEYDTGRPTDLQIWRFPESRLERGAATAISYALPIDSRIRLIQQIVPGFDPDFDAVIDISGYGMGDPWMPDNAVKSLARRVIVNYYDVFEWLDTPIVYMPQAWGPFSDSRVCEIAERRLQQAELVYARDETSYEYLAALPSFDEERFRLAPDIAFQFKGAPREVGERLLADAGLPEEDAPLIGVVPNMRVYERSPDTTAGESPYLQSLTAIIRKFAEKGFRVAIMPHEINTVPDAPEPDDRYLCRRLHEAVGMPERVVAVTGDYAAEELKAMIGTLDMLVSSRYHSVIAALSLRCPVVCVSWSHKYHELMKEAGLPQYAIDHRNASADVLSELCDDAWEHREQSARTLAETLPAIEASSAEAVSEATRAIRRAWSEAQ